MGYTLAMSHLFVLLLTLCSTASSVASANESAPFRHLVWATNDADAVERIGRTERLDQDVASASLIDEHHANTFRTVGFILDLTSLSTIDARPRNFPNDASNPCLAEYLDWDRLLKETERAPARSAQDWNEVRVRANSAATGIRVKDIFVRTDSLKTPVCGYALERAVESVRRRTGRPVIYLGPSRGFFTLAVARLPAQTSNEEDTLMILATKARFDELAARAAAAGGRIDGLWASTNFTRVHTTAGYFDGEAFVAEWRSELDATPNISERFERGCLKYLDDK